MKKIIAITIAILVLLALACSSEGKEKSLYELRSQAIAKNASKHEQAPNGKSKKYAEIKWKANHTINRNLLKRAEHLSGYVHEKALADKGARYTVKNVMTYKEYVDLGIDDTYRHDIDPNRLVWVFSSTFQKTHTINGVEIEKATVTTLYDAETGVPLTLHVSSQHPSGLKHLLKKKGF